MQVFHKAWLHVKVITSVLQGLFTHDSILCFLEPKPSSDTWMFAEKCWRTPAKLEHNNTKSKSIFRHIIKKHLKTLSPVPCFKCRILWLLIKKPINSSFENLKTFTPTKHKTKDINFPPKTQKKWNHCWIQLKYFVTKLRTLLSDIKMYCFMLIEKWEIKTYNLRKNFVLLFISLSSLHVVIDKSRLKNRGLYCRKTFTLVEIISW